ncbi:wall-associated receptor kinase 2-like [Hordeum vulgare subsp. vulgare]|uniref:Protein kinase domain-containing protein n=1 Tax=Hordeum vulgare subsp. vulgare TaxID=112509 RepID=M0WK91_HORVV|nr:wall-associated receptor kinase 2-like [Hordeum vulgare subsp. vulgare]XP_044967809.1 wall-associated receptor kinase 2-like [Hordeum vulgare subsp. vulgare]
MEPSISFRRPMAELLPFPLLPRLLLPLLICFSPFFVHSMESSTSGCSSSNISIPYPFGVHGQSPSPAQGFEINCTSSGPRLPIGNNSISILNISLLDGYVSILASAASRSRQCGGNYASFSFSLEGTNFTFSDTRNKFTAVGCNMVAMLLNGTTAYSGGCASFCSTKNSIVDGACSGVACCQAPVPKGLKNPSLEFTNITTSLSKDTSGCAEAFIVEQNAYVFAAADLNNSNNSPPRYRHVVLEWSIDGGSCEEANRSASYACKENSYCYNSSNGIGYRCNCTEGFEGNPYLQGPGGCQDIDECSTGKPCTHTCINTKGSFNCVCPSGMNGDGRKEGSGCSGIGTLQISIVVGLALLLLLLLLSFWTHCLVKRRKLAKKRQRYFMQNGGMLLKQQMLSRRAPLRIFTSGELDKATNKFSDNNIVGRGGFGTVYKGVLSDQLVVAVKRSQRVDQSQVEQFVNELVILSQVTHKNVVQLLGCCLEAEVPLLVYEFITNGALFHHLHNTSIPMSWEDRLRIAVETASALAYLHLAPKTPIVHRDVKSSNILLDTSFTAKVSDFGASRPLPPNQTHVTTLVQGTLGYMDPEYFQTSQLTEKSDVYSFGVVLIELLTREKPISGSQMDEVRSLAMHFSTLFHQNQLLKIVDSQVAEEAGTRHVKTVAQLALRCLRLRGEERPRMIEVAVELEALRRLMKQHSVLKSEEEEPLLPLLRDLSCRGEMNFDSQSSSSHDGIAKDESMELILLPSSDLSC